MGARYAELVIDGPRGWDMGFIQGFLRSRGFAGTVLDAEAEGFHCAGLREQLREALHPAAETLHLLVPVDLVPAILDAVDDSSKAGRPMAVRQRRAVGGAWFRFTVHVFSKEHARRVRAIFNNLPEGVALSADASFEEIVDDGVRGVELYAPVHAYEMNGEGAVEGDLEGVLAVHRACRKDEQVHPQALHILAE
jgi:hypothetical protein